MSSPPSSGVMNPKPCDSCVRWKVNFFWGELMPSTANERMSPEKGTKGESSSNQHFSKDMLNGGTIIRIWIVVWNWRIYMDYVSLIQNDVVFSCLVGQRLMLAETLPAGFTAFDWDILLQLNPTRPEDQSTFTLNPCHGLSIKNKQTTCWHNYLVGGFKPLVKVGIFSNFAGWKLTWNHL